MKKALAGFIRDERGATAIEYGLIVGLVALGITVAAKGLATDIGTFFQAIGTKITTILT
ncbi:MULTISPECIES: Flp family type IVb pilin [Cupriavidus]|uniref:Flp family type IVb pilin n=1 Tax=Cupriavidus sp. WS TaxID=1312922 RepID=UPI00037CBE89|nr:Flp family type IVb pilin [Cupriavidus sp. WS]